MYKTLLCNTYAFLDNDKEALKNFERAEKDGNIDCKYSCFAKCKGKKESEMEDLICSDVYIKKINEKFGILLEGKIFRNNKKKWKDRVKDVFENGGKIWNGDIEKDIKNIVAECVVSFGLKSLQNNCRPLIKNLIKELEGEIELLQK